MAYLRLFTVYLRLGLLGELEYRINFYIQLLDSVLKLVVAVGGLAIVFNHTDTLDGWLRDELIALVGIHMTIGGLIAFVISPSLYKLTSTIRNGNFDFVLTKPVDAQFVASVQRIEIWKLFDVLVGVAVVSVALLRLRTEIGILHTLSFALALVAGATIVYSFWLILATTAFWIVRAENIFNIFESIYVAGRWPISLYPGWLRIVMTFVVPIAFAVTVPAQGLTGRLTNDALLLAFALALAISFTARRFWMYGLRSYSGASA